MIFSASNVNFGIPSTDPVGPRNFAHASFKERCPFKSGYFAAIVLFSVKKVVLIGTGMMIIIICTNDELFSGVYIDDLE